MSTSPHKLIRASAGTGKTYRLTNQFLKLLFAGVPPERILATTFTRKAAGEILDRVLKRLVEATLDEDVRRELKREAGLKRLSAGECRTLLAQLVRKLDRFRIRTLDAFFVQLGRLFALDLGLPADWSIVDEVQDLDLRRDALAGALEETEPLELITLLRGLQKADASRSIARVLGGTVRSGRGTYLESEREAWEALEVPPGLDDEALAQAIAQLEAMPVPKTKKGTEVVHWKNAKKDILTCAREGDWSGLLEVGLVEKVMGGDSTFSRVLIEKEVREPIESVVRQAAHELVQDLADQNAATYEWLDRFERVYARRKAEERAFRFEDLPQVLAPANAAEPLTERELELWYRLDGRIDHLLLDEFQDTAPVQWRILHRIVEEILADGTGERSFFCVGDIKQSIYGWREAEPRLLEELNIHHPVLGEPESLDKSYRSAPVVLDTVNRIFQHVAACGATARRESYLKAAQEWRDAFHEQIAAKKELPGAVHLVQARARGEEEDADLPPLEMAAERVRAIVKAAPHATVGILLRRNKHIARLIYLLREKGLRASGEGGNPLTDSSAVLHAVSMFHLADHPGDSAAAFHVATSPLGAAIELVATDAKSLVADGRKASRLVRRRLAAEGYGRFCASLRERVGDAYGAWDRKRFDQLVDQAYAFDERSGLRARGFVDFLRETAVEDPSATRIQVMTVHAAKGLEFDAVVLPELDETDWSRDKDLLTLRPDPAGPIQEVTHSRSRAFCAMHPRLNALRFDQERRAVREALCILYVAMTRAKHRLDMIVQRKKDGKPRSTYSDLLREALGAPVSSGDTEVLWAHPGNDMFWMPPPKKKSEVEAAEVGIDTDAGPTVPRWKPSTGPRHLPRLAPSGEEGGQTLWGSELLRSRASSGARKGTLLHRWFQEVVWLEDFSRDDDALLELAAAYEPDPERRAAALQEFRAALERPVTRDILTRGARDPAVTEVWCERNFSVVLADGAGPGSQGALWSGAFDRVVVTRAVDGSVSAAELVDYKTDHVEGKKLQQRVEFYRPQLDAYRRALARMCSLEEGRIRAFLLFVAADELHEL